MIIHNVEQGTPEWLALRLGIPTASEFDNIITPAKGELSKQSKGYAHRLITERVLRRSLDSLDHLEWIERGKMLEPDAARLYEFERDCETRKVGFITTDDGQLGASPDRLIVGHNGGVELKCPAPHTHIGYMLDGFGPAYKVQVQGQMLVGGFEFIDRVSYHPEMPPVIFRTWRDDAFIELMRKALDEFNDMLAGMERRVRDAGYFQERDRIMTIAEETYPDVATGEAGS